MAIPENLRPASNEGNLLQGPGAQPAQAAAATVSTCRQLKRVLSLLKHSAIWERRWFQVVADYRKQIAESNKILHTFDLDAPCAFSEMAEQNLRFVALHMIEETARHAGHADIIRETIDGTSGH